MAENRIKLKRSNVTGTVPTTSDLELGEIGINTKDGKIFFQKDGGTIQSAVTTNSKTTGSIDISGSLTITGSVSVSGSITGSDNILILGGGLDIKNKGAQSYARFYCESNNFHYTEVKAQPHSLFSGNPIMLLPAYDFDFSKPKFVPSITASADISASGDIFFNPANATTGTSVLTIDPTTGKVFRTGSYSAGSSTSGGTNLTQSIFVTQNGDDTTGEIGNISKPFSTLKSASLAATTGSTIFVYPGLYEVEANYNLAKAGVDYYFSPNTTVSKSTAGDMFDLTGFDDACNVYGYADFILASNAGSLLKGSTGVEFDYTFQARDIISDSTVGGAQAKIVDHFTNSDFTANWEFRNMSGSNCAGFSHGVNNTNGILNLTCDSIITKNACISTGNGYRVANIKAKLLKSSDTFALLWYGGGTPFNYMGVSLIVDEAIGSGGNNSNLAYRFTSAGDIDIVGQTTGIQFGSSAGASPYTNGTFNHLGRCIHLDVKAMGASAVYNGSHVSKVDMEGDGVININWVITPNTTSDYIKQSSGKALVNILGYQNYSNLIQITGGTFIGDGCFYTRFPFQNIEVSSGTFIWKGKYDAYVNSTNYGNNVKNRRVIYQTGGTVKIQGTINLDGANFTSALPANIITYNGGKLILDGSTLTTVDNAQPAPAILLDQDRDVHIFSGGVNYNQTGSNALLLSSGSGFELTNVLGGMIIEDASIE